MFEFSDHEEPKQAQAPIFNSGITRAQYEQIDALETIKRGDFVTVYPLNDEYYLTMWVYLERGYNFIADLDDGAVMFFRLQ